jgi:hypothetical protein
VIPHYILPAHTPALPSPVAHRNLWLTETCD